MPPSSSTTLHYYHYTTNILHSSCDEKKKRTCYWRKKHCCLCCCLSQTRRIRLDSIVKAQHQLQYLRHQNCTVMKRNADIERSNFQQKPAHLLAHPSAGRDVLLCSASSVAKMQMPEKVKPIISIMLILKPLIGLFICSVTDRSFSGFVFLFYDIVYW